MWRMIDKWFFKKNYIQYWWFDYRAAMRALTIGRLGVVRAVVQVPYALKFEGHGRTLVHLTYFRVCVCACWRVYYYIFISPFTLPSKLMLCTPQYSQRFFGVIPHFECTRHPPPFFLCLVLQQQQTSKCLSPRGAQAVFWIDNALSYLGRLGMLSKISVGSIQQSFYLEIHSRFNPRMCSVRCTILVLYC